MRRKGSQSNPKEQALNLGSCKCCCIYSAIALGAVSQSTNISSSSGCTLVVPRLGHFQCSLQLRGSYRFHPAAHQQLCSTRQKSPAALGYRACIYCFGIVPYLVLNQRQVFFHVLHHSAGYQLSKWCGITPHMGFFQRLVILQPVRQITLDVGNVVASLH